MTKEQLGKTRLKTVLRRQRRAAVKPGFGFPDRQVLILLGSVNTEDGQCLPGEQPPPSPSPSIHVRLLVTQDGGAGGGAGRAADHLHPPETGRQNGVKGRVL